MGIQFSSSPLARANMRSFVALCLVAAAAGSPAKLGQARRQGRQGGYIAPVEEQAAYGNIAAASSVVDTRVAAEPIGIRSQSFDGPNPEFRYSFETENDISQSAEGTMKNVDGVDVVTMKGSYSYVGVDGNTWTVDWYADETLPPFCSSSSTVSGAHPPR